MLVHRTNNFGGETTFWPSVAVGRTGKQLFARNNFVLQPGMAGVEHVPGTRLLAVARRWDKCTVAVYVHRCSDDAARHLRAVVGQVVKSASTVVQTHPRLTITDQKAGTIHYETDEHAIYVLVTEPSYPQRTAFRCLDEFRQRFREHSGACIRCLLARLHSVACLARLHASCCFCCTSYRKTE